MRPINWRAMSACPSHAAAGHIKHHAIDTEILNRDGAGEERGVAVGSDGGGEGVARGGAAKDVAGDILKVGPALGPGGVY